MDEHKDVMGVTAIQDEEWHEEWHEEQEAKKTSLVEVVSGIITMGDTDSAQTRASHILLSQRLQLQDYPLTWECPGGKLNEEELAQATKEDDEDAPLVRRRTALVMALRRELREELDLDVNLTQSEPVQVVDFTTARGRLLRVTFLRVRAFAGRPTSREHQGWGWFSREQLHAFYLSQCLTPGNAMAYEAIAEAAFGARSVG
jgi:ADP-ribose pyrophosphatase YjhB (NUDIX family)